MFSKSVKSKIQFFCKIQVQIPQIADNNLVILDAIFSNLVPDPVRQTIKETHSELSC